VRRVLSGRERREIERDKQRRKERAERERQAGTHTPNPSLLFCPSCLQLSVSAKSAPVSAPHPHLPRAPSHPALIM